MKTETFYRLNSRDSEMLEILEIPAQESPTGRITLTGRFVIDAQGLDISLITLDRQGYDGHIHCLNGVLQKIVVQDSTSIRNALLSLCATDDALRYYKRIRDKKGREWQLVEGLYPTDSLDAIKGDVVTKTRITCWAAAMGRIPPHVFFVEENRKWALLSRSEWLPGE